MSPGQLSVVTLTLSGAQPALLAGVGAGVIGVVGVMVGDWVGDEVGAGVIFTGAGVGLSVGREVGGLGLGVGLGVVIVPDKCERAGRQLNFWQEEAGSKIFGESGWQQNFWRARILD